MVVAATTKQSAQRAESTARLVAVALVAASVVVAATTKQSAQRTQSTARLVAVTRAALLPTAEQRSCQLTDEVTRSTATMARTATVVLLSATKEGACKLANEIVRPTAAVALLVVSHERIHSEAAQRAVAGLAVTANTSRPITDFSRSV
jgi:hypothetical protein